MSEMPFPDVEYNGQTLKLLADTIPEPAYEVFKTIWNKRQTGIIKKDLKEVVGGRRRVCDHAVLILEAKSFIYSVSFTDISGFEGRAIYYYPTTRGVQLKDYLQQKAKKGVK